MPGQTRTYVKTYVLKPGVVVQLEDYPGDCLLTFNYPGGYLWLGSSPTELLALATSYPGYSPLPYYGVTMHLARILSLYAMYDPAADNQTLLSVIGTGRAEVEIDL